MSITVWMSEVQMIEHISVSIIPYDVPTLNEEDVENLVNFIVQVAQLGFEGTIVNGITPRKDIA